MGLYPLVSGAIGGTTRGADAGVSSDDGTALVEAELLSGSFDEVSEALAAKMAALASAVQVELQPAVLISRTQRVGGEGHLAIG